MKVASRKTLWNNVSGKQTTLHNRRMLLQMFRGVLERKHNTILMLFVTAFYMTLIQVASLKRNVEA